MDPLALAFLVILPLSAVFALLGMGGSSIYVPLFLWLGIPLEVAIPYGLLLNAITSGTALFICRKAVDLNSILWILAGCLAGAVFGAWLSTILPHNFILATFSAILVFGAYRMLRKTKPEYKFRSYASKSNVHASQAIFRTAIGGITGAISGLLGIGGGVFLVPSLISSGVAPKKAAMLSYPIVFFASAVGLISHLSFIQNFDYDVVAFALPAAFIGALIGSWKMANSKAVSDDHIKKAFGILLLVFAVKLAIDAFGWV